MTPTARIPSLVDEEGLLSPHARGGRRRARQRGLPVVDHPLLLSPVARQVLEEEGVVTDHRALHRVRRAVHAAAGV